MLTPSLVTCDARDNAAWPSCGGFCCGCLVDCMHAGHSRSRLLRGAWRGVDAFVVMSMALVLHATWWLCLQLTGACLLPQLLGVPPTATNREIKRAYRKKALELHPDKLGREVTEEDEQAFIDVVKAYEVLSDADQRRRYDAYGPEVGGACVAVAVWGLLT